MFLGEKPMLDWVAGNEPCDLLVHPASPVLSRPYALAFPKGRRDLADAFRYEQEEEEEEGAGDDGGDRPAWR